MPLKKVFSWAESSIGSIGNGRNAFNNAEVATDLDNQAISPVCVFVDRMQMAVSTGKNHMPTEGGHMGHKISKLLHPFIMLLCHVSLDGRLIHAPLATEWAMVLQLKLQFLTM